MLEIFSEGMLSYTNYDKSRKVKETLNIRQIDVRMTIKEFNKVADQIDTIIYTPDINYISEIIENNLYQGCNKHKIKRRKI